MPNNYLLWLPKRYRSMIAGGLALTAFPLTGAFAEETSPPASTNLAVTQTQTSATVVEQASALVADHLKDIKTDSDSSVPGSVSGSVLPNLSGTDGVWKLNPSVVCDPDSLPHWVYNIHGEKASTQTAEKNVTVKDGRWVIYCPIERHSAEQIRRLIGNNVSDDVPLYYILGTHSSYYRNALPDADAIQIMQNTRGIDAGIVISPHGLPVGINVDLPKFSDANVVQINDILAGADERARKEYDLEHLNGEAQQIVAARGDQSADALTALYDPKISVAPESSVTVNTSSPTQQTTVAPEKAGGTSSLASAAPVVAQSNPNSLEAILLAQAQQAAAAPATVADKQTQDQFDREMARIGAAALASASPFGTDNQRMADEILHQNGAGTGPIVGAAPDGKPQTDTNTRDRVATGAPTALVKPTSSSPIAAQAVVDGQKAQTAAANNGGNTVDAGNTVGPTADQFDTAGIDIRNNFDTHGRKVIDKVFEADGVAGDNTVFVVEFVGNVPSEAYVVHNGNTASAATLNADVTGQDRNAIVADLGNYFPGQDLSKIVLHKGVPSGSMVAAANPVLRKAGAKTNVAANTDQNLGPNISSNVVGTNVQGTSTDIIPPPVTQVDSAIVPDASAVRHKDHITGTGTTVKPVVSSTQVASVDSNVTSDVTNKIDGNHAGSVIKPIVNTNIASSSTATTSRKLNANVGSQKGIVSNASMASNDGAEMSAAVGTVAALIALFLTIQGKLHGAQYGRTRGKQIPLKKRPSRKERFMASIRRMQDGLSVFRTYVNKETISSAIGKVTGSMNGFVPAFFTNTHNTTLTTSTSDLSADIVDMRGMFAPPGVKPGSDAARFSLRTRLGGLRSMLPSISLLNGRGFTWGQPAFAAAGAMSIPEVGHLSVEDIARKFAPIKKDEKTGAPLKERAAKAIQSFQAAASEIATDFRKLAAPYVEKSQAFISNLAQAFRNRESRKTMALAVGGGVTAGSAAAFIFGMAAAAITLPVSAPILLVATVLTTGAFAGIAGSLGANFAVAYSRHGLQEGFRVAAAQTCTKDNLIRSAALGVLGNALGHLIIGVGQAAQHTASAVNNVGTSANTFAQASAQLHTAAAQTIHTTTTAAASLNPMQHFHNVLQSGVYGHDHFVQQAAAAIDQGRFNHAMALLRQSVVQTVHNPHATADALQRVADINKLAMDIGHQALAQGHAHADVTQRIMTALNSNQSFLGSTRFAEIVQNASRHFAGQATTHYAGPAATHFNLG